MKQLYPNQDNLKYVRKLNKYTKIKNTNVEIQEYIKPSRIRILPENYSDELSMFGFLAGGWVAYLFRPGQLSIEQILNAIFINKNCEHSLRVGAECVQSKIIDGQVITTLEYMLVAMILGYIIGWAVGKAIKRKP